MEKREKREKGEGGEDLGEARNIRHSELERKRRREGLFTLFFNIIVKADTGTHRHT